MDSELVSSGQERPLAWRKRASAKKVGSFIVLCAIDYWLCIVMTVMALG
jgi:hypothetical protein